MTSPYYSENKAQYVSNLLEEIERQYPHWPSTFGPCSKCGKHIARGSGYCESCLIDELSTIIGRDDAEFFARRVRKVSDLYHRIMNGVNDD